MWLYTLTRSVMYQEEAKVMQAKAVLEPRVKVPRILVSK